jgi:hypothetical protein
VSGRNSKEPGRKTFRMLKNKKADISIFFAIKGSRIWNLSSSEELGKYLGIPNN